MLDTKAKVKHPDSDEPLAGNTEQQGEGDTEVRVDSAQPQAGDLPVEPAVDSKVEADAKHSVETYKHLLRFFAHGARESDAPAVTEDCWPALLYGFRDLRNIRHDYPVCLLKDCADEGARPLTAIMDDVVREVAADGDEGERLKRHVYQLESSIKDLLEIEPGQDLSTVWDRAAADLLSTTQLTGEKKERLQSNLTLARRGLKMDGEMLSCGPEVPGRLLPAVANLYWRQHCMSWRRTLDSLITRLEDILRVDFDRSSQAKSPKHLRDSVGTAAADDMDFKRMSEILSHAHLGEPIPEQRHKRIENVLEILQRVRPLFGDLDFEHEAPGKLPFWLEPVVDDSEAAMEQHRLRMRTMVKFFRAARIAELEVDNRYREEAHSTYFGEFDDTYLTADELSLCPPVILYLSQEFFSESDSGPLLHMLASGLPFKIVIQLNDLGSASADGWSVVPGWPVRLTSMAMALNDIYVFQCSASRPSLVQSGFLAGLQYPGPALCSVYTGRGRQHSKLPTYLDAAAAMDSRAFPAFCFDPSRGATLAQRMELLDNPQDDQAWPGAAFRYVRTDDEEVSISLAFTLADFLSGDTWLEPHFWRVPVTMWHPEMLPLQEYLRLTADEAEPKIPYLTAVDNSAKIVRIVVTGAIVSAVRKCASSWRRLQELGGIRNSHALELLGRERERLKAERQAAVEAIEKEYAAQLDRDLGELTRGIVERIASQLISGAAGPVEIAATPAAERVAAPAVEAGEAETVPEVVEEAGEEEEEVLVLDEPYIDTPLCTTCDDCTNMSPQIFAYDDNKQAYIKDASAGAYREIVLAAEKCPVDIIHPGKPKNPDEPDLEKWLERARPYM